MNFMPVPYPLAFKVIGVVITIGCFSWSMIKLFTSLPVVIGLVFIYCFMVAMAGLMENGQPVLSVEMIRQLDEAILYWVSWTGINNFNE